MNPMRTRIDWMPGDPAAPPATSVVPGASVAAADHHGRLLMIQRTDSGNWAIPSGTMELGESLPDTAVRECLEETGIHVELTGLVGTFTHPGRRVEYRGDRPEVRQEFSITFTGRPISGELRASSETSQVRWVPLDELGSLPITEAMRARIDAWQHVNAGGAPHLG